MLSNSSSSEITNIEIPFWKRRQVAGDKVILLRLQLIEPRIQPLVEDNKLDLWNLNWAVSMILDLLFAIWIKSSRILTVSKLLSLLDFWINQNSTSIGPSKCILNDNDVSAKNLLIWRKIDKVRACYFFFYHCRDLFLLSFVVCFIY